MTPSCIYRKVSCAVSDTTNLSLFSFIINRSFKYGISEDRQVSDPTGGAIIPIRMRLFLW